jgi:hypothetical protein
VFVVPAIVLSAIVLGRMVVLLLSVAGRRRRGLSMRLVVLGFRRRMVFDARFRTLRSRLLV